jgi:hypothetical protein
MSLSRLCAPAILFASFSVSSLSLVSQQTQLGYSNSPPSFGHGHDYIQLMNETVNPADGSLTLSIGVPTPSGRGLNFPYALKYNSSEIRSLQEPPAGGPGGPIYVQWAYPAYTQTTYQGWSDTLPRLVVQHTPAFEGYVSPYGDQGWYSVVCEAWQGFQFTDVSGQVHQFNNFIVGGGSGGQDFYCPGGSAMGTDGTVQGEAFTINGNGGGAEYATADGTVYQFILDGSSDAGVVSALPYLIEDKNGNKLTIGDGEGEGGGIGPFPASTVTDTLGRTVISYQQGADANHKLLYVSGIPNPYIIALAQSSPSTGIAVPQVSYDYGSGSTANTLPPLPALSGGISSIGLPDGGSYTFSYDSVFGNINKITYPNGGYVSYTWGFPSDYSDDANYQSQYTICDNSVCNTTAPASDQIYVKYKLPAILSRTVSFDGQTTALTQTYTYTTTFQQGDMVDGWRSKTTKVTTNDVIAGTTSSVTYYYFPFQQYNSNLTQRYTGQTAQEYQIVYSDGSGTLQTVCKQWNLGADLLAKQITILPNNRVSEHDLFYGGGGTTAPGPGVMVPSGDDYYDFSAPQSNPTCANPFVTYTEPTPGALLSSTRRIFNSSASTSLYPYGPSIMNLPSSSISYGLSASGTTVVVAETDYQYTNAIAQTVSGVVQHDTAFDNGSQVRQNLLSATTQCFQSCTGGTTTYAYDNTGQVVSITDPLGNATNYSYADAFASGTGQPSSSTNAYVTTVTRPSTNGVAHVERSTYGLNDGKTRTTTDENSNVTTYCYWTGGCTGSSYDPWMRLTQIQKPDGGSQKATYNDGGSSPTVFTTTALNSSSNMVQTTVGDGMGHPIQTQLNSDPAGTVYVDTVYNGEGQVYSVTNPYRSTSDPTYGLTYHAYDALGRQTTMTEPDGSTQRWSYADPSTTFTDEASNSWTRTVDGAGRLISVRNRGDWRPPTRAISLEISPAFFSRETHTIRREPAALSMTRSPA